MKKTLALFLLFFSMAGYSQKDTTKHGNSADLGTIKRSRIVEMKMLNELIRDLPPPVEQVSGEMVGKVKGKVMLQQFTSNQLTEGVKELFRTTDAGTTMYIDLKYNDPAAKNAKPETRSYKLKIAD